jgi:hypothetical protein
MQVKVGTCVVEAEERAPAVVEAARLVLGQRRRHRVTRRKRNGGGVLHRARAVRGVGRAADTSSPANTTRISGFSLSDSNSQFYCLPRSGSRSVWLYFFCSVLAGEVSNGTQRIYVCWMDHPGDVVKMLNNTIPPWLGSSKLRYSQRHLKQNR